MGQEFNSEPFGIHSKSPKKYNFDHKSLLTKFLGFPEKLRWNEFGEQKCNKIFGGSQRANETWRAEGALDIPGAVRIVRIVAQAASTSLSNHLHHIAMTDKLYVYYTELNGQSSFTGDQSIKFRQLCLQLNNLISFSHWMAIFLLLLD